MFSQDDKSSISHFRSLRPEFISMAEFLQQVNTKTYTNVPCPSKAAGRGKECREGGGRNLTESSVPARQSSPWPFDPSYSKVPSLESLAPSSIHPKWGELKLVEQCVQESQQDYEDYTEHFGWSPVVVYFLMPQIAHLCPQQLNISSEDTNKVSNVFKSQNIYVYLYIHTYILFM